MEALSERNEEPTETAGEEVHPSEDRGNGGSLFCRLTKLILKVQSSSIVHGQLYSEATGVLEEQDPRIEVDGARTEGSRR